jgi:hypothetical protein
VAVTSSPTWDFMSKLAGVGVPSHYTVHYLCPYLQYTRGRYPRACPTTSPHASVRCRPQTAVGLAYEAIDVRSVLRILGSTFPA